MIKFATDEDFNNRIVRASCVASQGWTSCACRMS